MAGGGDRPHDRRLEGTDPVGECRRVAGHADQRQAGASKTVGIAASIPAWVLFTTGMSCRRRVPSKARDANGCRASSLRAPAGARPPDDRSPRTRPHRVSWMVHPPYFPRPRSTAQACYSSRAETHSPSATPTGSDPCCLHRQKPRGQRAERTGVERSRVPGTRGRKTGKGEPRGCAPIAPPTPRTGERTDARG